MYCKKKGTLLCVAEIFFNLWSPKYCISCCSCCCGWCYFCLFVCFFLPLFVCLFLCLFGWLVVVVGGVGVVAVRIWRVMCKGSGNSELIEFESTNPSGNVRADMTTFELFDPVAQKTHCEVRGVEHHQCFSSMFFLLSMHDACVVVIIIIMIILPNKNLDT